MKYLNKFESINTPNYKYDWCRPDSPIRIEIESSIKDILTELVEDGLYTYRVFWTENDPYVWISGSLKSGYTISRNDLNIELVEPFKSHIISYLNSEGFKTAEDPIKYSGVIREIRIRFK